MGERDERISLTYIILLGFKCIKILVTKSYKLCNCTGIWLNQLYVFDYLESFVSSLKREGAKCALRHTSAE